METADSTLARTDRIDVARQCIQALSNNDPSVATPTSLLTELNILKALPQDAPETNRNSLTGNEQEELHLAEFSALASSGQIQNALQALDQVSDPNLMVLHKDEIDTARNARALELTKSTPNEAMEYAGKVASGGGNPEIIQVVASEWLSKDPEAAFGWFQKARGLSSDQADQISRSFVQACLLQSDAVTAQMWADSIKNARVREDLSDGEKSQTLKH